MYAGQISAAILAIISLVVFAVVTAERRLKALDSIEEDRIKTRSYGRLSLEENDDMSLTAAEQILNPEPNFRREANFNVDSTDAASNSQRDDNSILNQHDEARRYRLVYWALLTVFFKLGLIEIVDKSSMGV